MAWNLKGNVKVFIEPPPQYMQNVIVISSRHLEGFSGPSSVHGEANLSGWRWDATRLSCDPSDGFSKRLWHLSESRKNTHAFKEFAK